MTLEQRDIAMFRQYATFGPVTDKDRVQAAQNNGAKLPIGDRFRQKVERFVRSMHSGKEPPQAKPLKTRQALDMLIHAFHDAPDVKSQQIIEAQIIEFATITTALGDIQTFYGQLHVPEEDTQAHIDRLESQFLLPDLDKQKEAKTRILDVRDTMEKAVLQKLHNGKQ